MCTYQYVNNTPVQSMAEKMIQMVGEDEEGYVSFPAFFRIYLDVHHRVHSLHPLRVRMRHRAQPVANSVLDIIIIIIIIIMSINNMYIMPAPPQH
jgi:hypothetical protein